MEKECCCNEYQTRFESIQGKNHQEAIDRLNKFLIENKITEIDGWECHIAIDGQHVVIIIEYSELIK